MKHSEAFEKLVAEIKPLIKEISIEEVVDWQKSAKPFSLIDVREDNEWSEERIDKAHHLGKGIIERDIEKCFPDRESCLVLYCGGGYRSALAAHNISRMGYKNIYSMQGGFRSWKEKGLPISDTKADFKSP
jgi:rhodanese-related sulfurtransferase